MTAYFTCLSLALWNDYARHTIASWDKLDGKVIIYSEDWRELQKIVYPFVEVRSMSPQAIGFQDSLTSDVRREAFPHGAYCYRKDIAKFAWPVFTWASALRDLPKSVWMDADVAVKVRPPESLIFPDNAEVSYLGRTHHPRECPYTESGLIGFNIRDVNSSRLFAYEMERMLTHGTVYKLKQWHDCTIFDDVRKRMEKAIRFVSISRDETKDHVFDHTLSDYLHHYRGPARKKLAHLGEEGMKTHAW